MTAETVEALVGPLAGIELGPAAQSCSERERRFAFLMAIHATDGNAAAAARLAGYSDPGPHSGSIKVKASQLMHHERVIAAVAEFTRNAFRGLEPVCVAKVRRIVENEKHPDHAKVCLSLLSRYGYSERTQTDVTVSGSVTVNHTDAAVDDLRRLKLLGVPKEKLLEIFGFSGLDRYEAMLAEKDARAPKVIEHRSDEAAPGSIDQHHNPMDGQ
jgi:hypothetical protein